MSIRFPRSSQARPARLGGLFAAMLFLVPGMARRGCCSDPGIARALHQLQRESVRRADLLQPGLCPVRPAGGRRFALESDRPGAIESGDENGPLQHVQRLGRPIERGRQPLLPAGRRPAVAESTAACRRCRCATTSRPALPAGFQRQPRGEEAPGQGRCAQGQRRGRLAGDGTVER